MIEKIIKIRSIGLLHRGVPSGSVDLTPITLIYSENGRGKSTFAAVLRSLASGDVKEITIRQTLDSQDAPEFACRYVDPANGATSTVEFQNGRWNATCSDIAVYDAAFVNRNVYSGFDVDPSQRQSLLEFAIGERSVALKKKIDDINEKMEQTTKKRSAAERSLKIHAGFIGLDDFIALKKDDAIDKKIAELRSQAEAAKNAEQLLKRQDPVALQELKYQVEQTFDLLHIGIPNMQADAEQKVRDHFQKHTVEGIEGWVAQGQKYLAQDCPFCSQSLDGVELIQAYQFFFNEEYKDLKNKIAELSADLPSDLPDNLVASLLASTETNTARIQAWSDHVQTDPPSLNAEELQTQFGMVKSTLEALVHKKSSTPLEDVGTEEEKRRVEDAIAAFNAEVRLYNAEVAKAKQKIDVFKAKLQGEDSSKIEKEIKTLELQKARHQKGIIDLIEEYLKAKKVREDLDTEKTEAREQLDRLMDETLQKYQTKINQLLEKCGAEFSIEGMKSTYAGGGDPRTEYVLKLRNKVIRLAPTAGQDSEPTFAHTLSEGDKRTLAFAFFVAKMDADPALKRRVLVIDDPVASLDLNRKDESAKTIIKLAQQCKQVILLSHEPYFLRDVRQKLAKLKPAPVVPTVMQIDMVQNGYSEFQDCDLDLVCADNYVRHTRTVLEFLDGSIPASSTVGMAMRHMLEGYYHRRFPLHLRTDRTLGDIIAEIRSSQSPHPLSHLLPLLDELSQINDYATRFHHDNEENVDTSVINATELQQYARRAVKLVHEQG